MVENTRLNVVYSESILRIMYGVRNTVGSICQYMEDQDLPHCLQLLVDLRVDVMPKVVTQVYIRDRKIWKLFEHVETGEI